jgi:anti-sigma-K factor RskA
MSLPARELRVLSGIETALQAGETRLTSMFAIFTRLATDEGKPGTEDLGTPSWNRWAAGRPPVRLRAIALVAVLAIASAVLFSVSAGSVRACGPAVLAHTFERAPSRATACQSSPPVPAPRPSP